MGDYDSFVADPPVNKTKTISTVCSAKAQKHTMHYKRLKFIERLTPEIPEMERFGEGFNEIPNKATALDSYKYHIAIEKHICDQTESSRTPFRHDFALLSRRSKYSQLLPKDSFIPININDFEGSLRIIKSAIANNEYDKRLAAIQEARRLDTENTPPSPWFLYQLKSDIRRISQYSLRAQSRVNTRYAVTLLSPYVSD